MSLVSVEETRAYARNLLAKRVDMLKVDLDLTLDQLRAVIEEAAKAGVPVVGHSQNIRKAAEAGLKYMEHTDTLGRGVLNENVQAGGKVAAGTDAGFMPGITLHYEMQMLVDAGIPPMKVIQAATLWGAESIGQQKDLGSIEPGKLADVTVIEGNPLNDITATKNIRMVIKDGKVLD